jgi:hypothetical protein
MADAMPAAVRTVRAAAHVHSAWSDDASWPLSRIAAAFARLRYSVVLMAEHSRGFSAAKWQEYTEACREQSNERVTLVPGIEYGDEDDVVHIPVWGRVPFLGEAPCITTLLGEVTEAGGTAVWAHPWRRDAWQRFDPSWRQHLAGVEVWNRKYDGIAPSRRSVELSHRHETRPFVALDFHTRRQLFPLSLALQVERSTHSVTAPANLPSVPARPPPGPARLSPGPARLSPVPARAPSAPASLQPRPACPPLVSVDDVYAALRAGRFSPRAFGLPLDRLTGGVPGGTLRMLELGRRVVARLVS